MHINSWQWSLAGYHHVFGGVQWLGHMALRYPSTPESRLFHQMPFILPEYGPSNMIDAEFQVVMQPSIMHNGPVKVSYKDQARAFHR